jgi:hypothetical protein
VSILATGQDGDRVNAIRDDVPRPHMFPASTLRIPTENHPPILPTENSILDGLATRRPFLPKEQVPRRHDSQKETPKRRIPDLTLAHSLTEVVDLRSVGMPRNFLKPPMIS